MASGAKPKDDVDQSKNRKKRDMLKLYYGEAEEGHANSESAVDPCNINGAHFEPDVYLNKLLKERSLSELMDKETEMVRHIKALDSDMQTLVYENYNKFISATDTIRKMKNDFRKMEDEMDHLATNMAAITEFSASISNTLQDRRQQITKLSGVHLLLKKLQFLFELPTRLQKCIDMEAYSQAVRYYTKSRKVLHQYQHVASFQGIQSDCQRIVEELRQQLRNKFRDRNSSPKQLAECVDLLLQLNEPAEELCEEFLAHARQKIDEDLVSLDRQLRLQAGEKLEPDTEAPRPAEALMAQTMDVLEFVDCGCNGFLSNVCLVIASYNDMFLNRQQDDEQLDAIALKKLVQFVNSLMETYFSYVQRRVLLEKETGDNTILVRALDRFHRRLQAMNKLLPDTDFSRAGTDIVSHAARDRVAHYLNTLQQHFADCLTDIRQSLAAPRLVGKTEGGSNQLSELLHNLHTALLDQVKSVMANLQAFIASDITFAMKPYFRGPFCSQDVREGLVVAFLHHIMSVCIDFCEATGEKGAAPPALLLILSRLCLDLEQSTITYLVTLVDEQFMVDSTVGLTPTSKLASAARDTAQRLLNHYVRVQGLTISQMLRKSVETRDWLNTIEPRNVRAVMKRVVEDITAMDSQVGQLYEEGVRKERSSDSTKRSLGYSTSRPTAARSNWSYTPSTIDNSLMSNIQKLFSERIEIFSAVEFSKVSVLTGIIKISLKTFLECVRLRTFGRYGLQQIQVDTHYLQLYLWRFVSDENLVHFLLDEIVGSTVHRCLDPATMETSVSAHRFQLLIRRVDFGVEKEQAEAELSRTEARRELKAADPMVTTDMLEDFDEAVYWKVMTWKDSPYPEDLGPMEDPGLPLNTDLLASIRDRGLVEPLVPRLPDVVTSTQQRSGFSSRVMSPVPTNQVNKDEDAVKRPPNMDATQLKQQFDVDAEDVVVILKNQTNKNRRLLGNFRLPWQQPLVEEKEITVLAESTISMKSPVSSSSSSEQEFFDAVQEPGLLVDISPLHSPVRLRSRTLSVGETEESYDMMADIAQVKDMDIRIVTNPRFTFEVFSECSIL